MTVLKHNASNASVSNAVVLDLSDLGAQARRLLDNARAEAARIIESARQDAEQIRADAHAAGLAEGRERGEAEGRQQGAADARQDVMDNLAPRLEQLTEAWELALQQWDQSRRDMLLEAKEDVLTFAFELAQKVIARAIEHDSTIVQDQLAAALDLLNRPTALRIAVHPDDEPAVRDLLPRVMERLSDGAHAEVMTDPSVRRGGCIVRTAGGTVDATLDTQLARMAEALLPNH